ncbi:MAG: M43 family zinc metalloprotease [Chitinophagaceae bacterium]
MRNSFITKNRKDRFEDADSLYTLPVVVHVIHTGTAVGAPDNPADTAIAALITNLNNSFRKNGPLYGGVDMKIQFQLATRSPQNTVTTGITRTNGSSVPNYVSGGITNSPFLSTSAFEPAVKRLSRWPNTDYINIWIVNKIDGEDSFGGGGYAYFPEYSSSITDGLVLKANTVDGTNKTIVHEMGHYFFLYHAFTDGDWDTSCAENTSCNTQGDLICDTEPFKIQFDCSGTINSCTGNNYLVADVPHSYTVLQNYMGYTNCQWMFTAGQKERARWALLAFRLGLISSGALSPPVSFLPAVACTPVAANPLSAYYGVEKVDFNTLHVYSNTSSADSSFYVDRTVNQSTQPIKGNSYPLTISGSHDNWHRIKVFIDYNNNGNFNDTGETVLDDAQGRATAMVTIPLNAKAGEPLRMRVVADNPSPTEPGACLLTGDAMYGSGQVEDYTVVLVKRQIQSITSGAWNTASNWTCNCIPQADDQVVIKAAHTITITPAMGSLQCGKLTLETGSHFNVSGTGFKITGNH